MWAGAEQGWLPISKSEIWSICPQNLLQVTHTMQTNRLLQVAIISRCLSCRCMQQRTSAVQQYSCALLFRRAHPPWSGCTNEDIAEQCEQADQQSQRKVNEAAEVTLSSMLLIAVFE